ncbi:beta-ketoacyl-[acyl-carrier-protein] synthase family protein [Polyangium sorediatum]|uniref:Beta-ketoacyl-[acyl-carrier-protein] synthase family protein n=1 Tax=Polyangium sorediatum TaxID=889274 RepID=A0ABT6NVH0_9BACT|nr:beta-ketoacyl-[acyl-carrier-protein] synthase family protein [Polyangium sorediatum]MDI1432336.1 beta-ketoacyl-[acyl-carrier-protein] synthase family protein [Polyangium sorediatum]
MKRRVFVRGRGAITPLGETWPASRDALAEGRSAVAPVQHFDVEGYPSQVAATVPFPLDEAEDRRLALARRAADEAWAEARVNAAPSRIGVFVGAESGRATYGTIFALSRAAGGGARFDHARFGEDARALATAVHAAAVSPAAVASALAARIGAEGPVETISLACASGAAAIVSATQAIRLGLCDVALAGGVGADVDPFMLVGFGLLGALSARGVSCPFDLRRDGFVVGEGAAFVVLAAEQGDARAEVAGAARTLDAFHLTAPDQAGDGAERAMRGALDDAGRVEIGYVQAHGTSTQLNDAVEAAAIRRTLGDALANVHVGAVKGAVGHWVAGAGAIGFLCALEAVEGGICLPTAGLTEPDPACVLPHVVGAAKRKPVEAALVNAFAFGGANTSLVVSRCA